MTAGFPDLIQADLHTVNQRVEKILRIKPGHMSEFAHLELDLWQKQLHPALVLLSGRLFNYQGQKLIHLATVVQLISLAAAIHFRISDDNDNPVEGADPRDGAQLPVLVGDYLYSKYFVELCEGEILECLSPLAKIIAEMNHGALLRRKNSGRSGTDLKPVLAVIEKETALLQEGAARLAGVLAQASPEEVTVLADFGRNLGMAAGILERNLDPVRAESYFDQALAALGKLPAGEARDGLQGLLDRIRQGVLVTKTGCRMELSGGTGRNPGFSEQYRDKEDYVHSIFSSIAKKYDMLNTVLSFNQDKYWRKFTVEQTGLKSGGFALDVCCGTGMLTVELAKKAGAAGKVVGLDFCAEMLAVAEENLQNSPARNRIEYVLGNATELPFADNMFDCATIGFGLRNVPDREKTIREMIRVVKQGGRVVCLEFSKPTVPVFKQVYNFYFDKWVPLLGRFGVGIDGPYRYLNRSWKVFPHQKELCAEFSRAGLQEATYYELTWGIVSVHVGVKPAGDAGSSSVAAAKQ